MKINYCSQCGAKDVRLRVPDGDSRARFICASCHFIHYQNPNIVAGCLVTHGDKILICKRAIEPRKGMWTLPAGFMENHETVEQAAARETWEEARAEIKIHGLFTLLNLPHINQVYMIYRGDLVGSDFGPGPESSEVRLIDTEDIPWEELAFPTIRETLKLYIEDLEHGQLRFHCGDIIRPLILADSRNAWLGNRKTR